MDDSKRLLNFGKQLGKVFKWLAKIFLPVDDLKRLNGSRSKNLQMDGYLMFSNG